MIINKFQGKTEEEAKEKAIKELGENAVIMSTREVKPKGFFRFFMSSSYEVTAALEEREPQIPTKSALKINHGVHEKINLAADEKIELPKVEKQKPSIITEKKSMEKPSQEPITTSNNDIEKKLENLSTMLEEKLGAPVKETKTELEKTVQNQEALNLIRIIYNTLIANEVDEKYVNQIMGEIESTIKPGHSIDLILSNVYQKLILTFGKPVSLTLGKSKPKVVFFIGPTGVGKTTTIAKIASKFKVDLDKKIAFITADTYRIAATEQLRVYANILDAPMSIVYTAEDMNQTISKFEGYDMVFVDTAGFSHRNETQREDIKKLIAAVDEQYEKEVYLVLSATTKYNDLLEIIDIYKEICSYRLIFTKLDETNAFGNLLNVKLYSDADLSYVTCGQNVPDDIEIFNTQKIVKQLLGGRE